MKCKYSSLPFIILLLIEVACICSGCASISAKKPSAEPGNPAAELSEYVRQGKVDELSLTIHYMNPHLLTRMPVSEEYLIERWYEIKVTVSGELLEKHIDLVDQVAKAAFTPVKQESYVNARLYYVFESKDHRKIFSVCMWSGDSKSIVNGIEVQNNDILYDVVMPFLPDDAAEELKTFMDTTK